MSLDSIKAQLKGLAFQAAGLFGYNQAIRILEEVTEDLRREQWKS